MKRLTFLKGLSWLSSALLILGKSAESQSTPLSVSETGKKKISISQFGDQDRTGNFSITHVDCKPTNVKEQILITEDAVLAEDALGNMCDVIGRISWNGQEAWSSWLSPDWLKGKGLSENCALYCRPIQMPGENSVWLSFLPDRESRIPYRDEIYRRESL
jgi:hypothetical protein